jgi:NADPH2:quinone reductase
MRAIAIEEFGDPEGLHLVDAPVPVPHRSQVLIRTEAIGVGGVDAVIRRGTLGGGFSPGLIPGSEVAGTVAAVGPDADPAWIGRQVWAFIGTGGGYAELAVAHVDDIIALPPRLTAVDAVTLGSAGTVAHFALEHAHFAAGESVLVRGAAGSIGIATVELAARAGASLVAVTASSPERGRRLMDLGATQVLDRSGAGDGADRDFDVIIDIVGGPGLPRFLDRLAPNGRLILVGAVAGYPPADFGMSLLHAFQQSRSFATFSLATVPIETRNRIRAAQFDAATRGLITPVVHDVLPLERASEAHRLMDAGSVFGRIVLIPSESAR